MHHITNIIIIPILCICTVGYVLGATIQSLASNTEIDTASSSSGPKLEKRQPTRFFPSRLDRTRRHEIQIRQEYAGAMIQELRERAEEARSVGRQAQETNNYALTDIVLPQARDADAYAHELDRLVEISRSDSRSTREQRNRSEDSTLRRLGEVYDRSTGIRDDVIWYTANVRLELDSPGSGISRMMRNRYAAHRPVQEQMYGGEAIVGSNINQVVESGQFLANAQPHGHPQPGSPGNAYERLSSRFIEGIASLFPNRDSPHQHQIRDLLGRRRLDSREVDQIATTGNEYQHRTGDEVPPPPYSEEPRGQHYYYGNDPPPIYDSRHHRRRDPQVSIIPDHQLAEFVDIVRQACKAIVEADSYEYDFQQQKSNISSSSGSDSSEKKPDDISGLYPEMLSNLLDLATMVEVFIQVPGLSLAVPA